MKIAYATETVKNADDVISFVDRKLSEVSYLKVENGYVKVTLDFKNAVTILTAEVKNLVIQYFKGYGYSDVSIILESGSLVLKMKSPIKVG